MSEFDYIRSTQRRHSLPLTFVPCSDDRQVSMTIRQPSFAFLKIGSSPLAKNGEELCPNSQIVFDADKAIPAGPLQKLSRSSLYSELSKESINLTIDLSPKDDEDRLDFDDIDLNNHQFYCSSPKDRKSQILRKLYQLNESRWQEIGYFPNKMNVPISV